MHLRNQKWGRLGESHAQDIRVHWPDGHFTDGTEHVSDLKFQHYNAQLGIG